MKWWLTRKKSALPVILEPKTETDVSQGLISQLWGTPILAREEPFKMGAVNEINARITALEMAVKALHYHHAESNRVRRKFLDYMDSVEQHLMDSDHDVAHVREIRRVARALLPEYKGFP